MVSIHCEGSKFKDIELVCINKDGTILTYTMYLPVMSKRAELIIKEFNLTDECYDEIRQIMGVDPETNTINLGGAIHNPRLSNIKSTVEYLRQHSVNTTLEEIVKLFDEVDDLVDFSPHIELIEGTEEILTALKEKNTKIVLTTLDSTPAAKKHLKHAGILEYFDLVLGLDIENQSTYHAKPAPDVLQYACKILDVNVSNSIIIGDDNLDMLVGKNAGARACIGVLSGRASREELKQADIIVDSVANIKVK